jgi:hypothetical protein
LTEDGTEPARIYLESNVLIESQWPRVSVKLRELIGLARAVNIEISVPEPVQTEVEAHFFRVVQEAERNIRASIVSINGLTSGLREPIDLEPAKIKDLIISRATYRETERITAQNSVFD